MPHKIWTGSINFGLVTIPVGLYSATEDHTIQFHQYERGTTDRVRYKRVNERTGNEVSYNDIVKGREVGGTLVTVDPKELEEIAPGRSRTIDIITFVDLDEIDPIFFQKTYWLAPSDKGNDRPYNLLRAAMEDTNQVGIARFVLRGKEYLTALRADRNVLALETLFFADEIRDPSDLLGDTTSGSAQASSQELKMATGLIDSMSGSWNPEEYEDTYTARVERLLDDKARGLEPEHGEAPPQPTDVIDLTDALRRSVDAARKGRKPDKDRARDKGRDKGGEDVTHLTKAALEKKAKELDIPGRSKMSRDDLEHAVAAAQGASSGRPRRPRKKAS